MIAFSPSQLALLRRAAERGWALLTSDRDLIVAESLEASGHGAIVCRSPYAVAFHLTDMGREIA